MVRSQNTLIKSQSLGRINKATGGKDSCEKVSPNDGTGITRYSKWNLFIGTKARVQEKKCL